MIRGVSVGSLLAVTALLFSMSACEKEHKIIDVSIMPDIDGAKLHFRGYVTDEDEELVGKLYEFDRVANGAVTVEGKTVNMFTSNGDKFYYYTDENGTVWQQTTVPASQRVLPYGLLTDRPITISEWEIAFKQDQGKGTEWTVDVDTAFSARTFDGDSVRIRYVKKGKARFDGWTETFLPEPYINIEAVDAYWYDLQTYFINETARDTLYGTKGIAHLYFDPKVGAAVKYIANYTKQETGKVPEKLRGTWELMRSALPEKSAM